MAVGGTFTALQNGLKRRYDDSFLNELGWSKGALAAMLKKVAWSGSNPVYAMRVGNSPAIGATFSNVKTISESSTGITRIVQPQLTWKKMYGRATIDNLLIATAGDKMGTFYDQYVAQIDGIMDGAAHALSTHVYRDGFGAISSIKAGSSVSTTTLTLANREDAVLFEIGMVLVFSSSNNGAVLRNSGGTLTVAGIDTNAGTLTMSAAVNSNTGTAAGDFIFPQGNRQDSATPTALVLGGLAAWFPTTAPSVGTLFNNLDRGTDTRLQGVIIDASTVGYTEEEAYIQALTETMRLGGKPKVAFLNPTRMANLTLQTMGRYRPSTIKGPGRFGVDGIALQTSQGYEIQFYADLFCPVDRGYLLEMESLQIYGAGTNKMPNFLMTDGNKILRVTDEDAIEARVGYYAEMACDAPCHNAVIKFA